MNNKRENKEIKDYFIYGFGQVINLLAPLLVAPKIIQVSGMENWGKVGIALSFFTIVSIIIDFGSGIIGVKEISINIYNREDIVNYLKKTYNTRVVLFSVILIFFIPFFFIFNLDKKIYFLGLFFLLAQVFNPIWYFQGIQDFKTINKIIFFSKGIYVISVYLFFKETEAYKFLIFVLGISNSMVYFYFFNKLRKEFAIKMFEIESKNVKEIFKKEYPIVLSNLSVSVYTNAPVIIIGYLLNNYYAGIYKVGEMVLSIFRSYLTVFFNVSFPKICSKFVKDKEEGKKFLKKINIINLIFLIFSIVFVYLFYIYFIDYFNLSKSVKSSVSFSINFLIIALIVALNIPFYQTLIFFNKQKIISNIFLVNNVLMLLLCFFLTKEFKILGSLFSVYFSELFITTALIVLYFQTDKNLKK